VSAQFSGRLAGTVVDSSHAPVAGASVTLTLSGGKNALLTTATANDGTFHFIGVRATEYDIAVAAPGFAKTTLRSLTVDPARETDIPTIELQLLSVTQSVDVVADVQKVETGSVEIADTISVEQVEKLPMLDRDHLGCCKRCPASFIKEIHIP
jgi:phage tail sheath gpL-like